MNQVWKVWPRQVVACVGTVAMLLAVWVGTAHAQPRPFAGPGGRPVAEEAPGAAENDKPVPPAAPKVNPNSGVTSDPANVMVPQTNLLYEVTSWFVIIMFTAGGIVALAVTARFFSRLGRPTDFRELALSDPWVRARLAQLEAAGPNNPTDPPVETEQVETEQ